MINCIVLGVISKIIYKRVKIKYFLINYFYTVVIKLQKNICLIIVGKLNIFKILTKKY